MKMVGFVNLKYTVRIVSTVHKQVRKQIKHLLNRQPLKKKSKANSARKESLVEKVKKAAAVKPITKDDLISALIDSLINENNYNSTSPYQIYEGVTVSNYSEKLRRERRQELAQRALPTESFNEYGEAFAVTKTEAGASFPAAAYAYVPDPESPSTWKLRLWATPDGGPDAHIVGAAMAALGKGFRGNKVDIPDADREAVMAKVKAAWMKANPDKKKDEMPSSMMACGDMMGGQDSGPELGYGPVEGPDRDFLESLLPHHGEILALIAKTDFEDNDIASFAGDLAEELIEGAAEIRSKLAITAPDMAVAEAAPEAVTNPSPDVMMRKMMYSSEEFGSLPPALKAAIVKGLEKKLAAETDPKKKAEIQAKIDNFNGGKKEEMATSLNFHLDPIMQIDVELSEEEYGTLPPALKAAIVKGLEKKLAAESDPTKKAAIQARIDKLK